MALNLDFGVRASATDGGGPENQRQPRSWLGQLRPREMVAIGATLLIVAGVSLLAVTLYLAQPGGAIR
jgi:hypothetical protein